MPRGGVVIGVGVGVALHLVAHRAGLRVDQDNRWLAMLGALPFVLLGLHYHPRFSPALRWAYAAFLSWVLASFGRAFVGAVLWRLEHPSEWDFLGFWLHARSAVNGMNFYDHASAKHWPLPFEVSRSFRVEILDVGFWYPPPSMFLFLPLGWLDWSSALAFWYALHAGLLTIAVVLLHRSVFRERTLVELGVCAAVILMVSATVHTVAYAQTTFALLVAFLLFWRSRRTASGGAWLSVAVFVKPFIVVLLLLPLFRRWWPVLHGFLGTTAALMLASLAVFGPKTVTDYFIGSQRGNKPDWIFSEETNQSLLGLILRHTEPSCAGTDCVLLPAFIVLAAMMGALTLFLLLRRPGVGDELTATAALLLGLILYPVSQSFYSLLLVVPLLMLWRERGTIPLGQWVATGVIVTTLLIADWQPIWAYLFSWILVLVQVSLQRATLLGAWSGDSPEGPGAARAGLIE